MNLPTFCINRPAFTIVISLVMVIVGLIGFINLPLRWIPNVTPPEVSISTTYPGANAQLVERDVTKPIEDALSGIDGIEMLTSNSSQGMSDISITFKLGRNMDAAVEDVRSGIERVRGELPKDIDPPVVMKADPNNDAIMYISFADVNKNERELSDYIDKFITPSFETIDGVGTVTVYGKRVSALRISLDPQKMAAANVTVDEVTTLLHNESVSIPTGQIRGLDRYYSIVTNTALKTPEQFNELIIRDSQNQIIRLKDIGEARLDAEDKDNTFRVSGRPGIALGIVTQSMANPLDVEKRVQKVFADLKKTLPNGMQAKIIYNQADYIRASIHSVYESFFEAIIFVWIVIFAFLCSFRATLIPIITIPICLISTFALLYLLGFSINTITLMAFVLAIGLVVDDAIVMLENINRHLEHGLSSLNAAIKGSGEIILPIIAMTLTLAAVYAPIAFTPGLLGILFREFTFTLAGAVIISGIVALTLSPMLCAYWLKSGVEINRYGRWLASTMQKIQTRYQHFLHFILQKRKWVILALFFVIGMGAITYHYLPAELAPAEDMNQIYVSVAGPHNASFQYVDNNAKQLETIYNTIPDIDSYLSMSGGGRTSHEFQLLLLKPKRERQHSTAQLIESLSAQANTISGVRVNVFAPLPPLAYIAGGDDGDSVGLVMMTSKEYPELQKSSHTLLEAIKQMPGILHAYNSLKWDSEQFQADIDRDKAADLQVPVENISNTLSTFIAGKIVGKVDENNIIVRMGENDLTDPNVFQELYVKNKNGQMIPITNILNINTVTTPEVFKHYNRLRSDTIFLSLAPHLKISDAIKNLQTLAKDNLPEDVRYEFTGEAKNFLESNGKTFFTFGLALIFIYLVLVAQFESFIDPLIIILTVPFAIVGALLTLKLFGGSLNIYSNIGLITLIGLIAKHGILITEFANRLRASGKSVTEAVIEAATLRLRPILMTTLAMVLGALPLALAFGPGAESREQVGLVIAGGLLFGTIFSLIIVPVTYTYLAPFRKLLVNNKG